MKFKNESIQNAFNKMESFFAKFAEPTEEIVTTEQKFTDVKLQTGEVIQYDAPALEQGVVVNIVTPEGILPVPDGEYVLEDGSKLVTSGGLVAEYVPAEPVEDGEVVEPEGTPAPAPASAMDTVTAPKRVIKSQVEEHVFSLELEGYEPIKVDFSSMFSKLVAENKELKETLKETFEAVKELGDEPAVKPTEKKQYFATKQDREDIRASIKKLTKY